MQYLHFGIKAGDGPRYAAQPSLMDRHKVFLETWRIENGSSGDCKCNEFFISNSWPALPQRILDFLGANVLCWNVLKKLDLNGPQWLPPHHHWPLPDKASSPSVQPLLPALSLPQAAWRLPCWHHAGSRQECWGVSGAPLGAGGGCSQAWILLPCHWDCFYSWQDRATFGCLFSFLLASSPGVHVKYASLAGFLKGCSAILAAAYRAGGSGWKMEGEKKEEECWRWMAQHLPHLAALRTSGLSWVLTGMGQ